ncbi:family 20 glycosylhydrolase [Pseudoalteromonas spongiae]|uniref:family 20 glycosylhydrolase n=1 Tax=Pseudoalteromonas spongiae TaxID=298657 RepID=UPI000C2D3C4F|nr:family 20 glycosylhydrolase [Pseudoalteromonas spongiae]
MNKLLALSVLCLVTPKFVSANQHTIDTLANELDVNYRLISASPKSCPADEKKCYLSELTLTNPSDLKDTNFAIFFSQLMPIYAVESTHFDISHINGDVHKISAKKHFKGFTKNTPEVIRFYSKDSQITRSEFMPNYIISDRTASDKVTARTIKSTHTRIDPETGLERQPYLAPFTSLAQLRVSKQDQTPWMSPQYLYQTQLKPSLNTAPVSLIPKPNRLDINSADNLVKLSKGLNLAPELANNNALSAALTRLESFGIGHFKTGIPTQLTIDNTLANEAYQLTLAPNAITITASSNTGAFYALMSIAGLVSLDNLSVPSLTIIDEPHFEFRGLHIDVARNFRSKQFILDTLSQMAAYKLNKLHLHLADDEGWRLAINDLPELTEVGAYRCLDLNESECLLPQLGAGIDKSSPVNGFYSKADYQEILKFAALNHIEVIPSLDMPGHSRAAVKAMDARYKKYMQAGEQQKAEQYWLSEANDTTQYSSIQHYNDNTLNVCLPSTYTFIEKVIDELIAMHHEVGVELATYHIGADETAGAWLNSPACNALKASTTELTSFNGYFIEKVSQLVASKGIKVAAWNDGLGDTNPQNMPSKVQSNGWSMITEDGYKEVHQQANLGWDMVLSTPEVTYFDFPYQSHPEERGNHWAARAIDGYKVFGFMPENLPAHAEIWQTKEHLAYRADDNQERLNQGIKFKGLQGHLWSEMLRSDNQAEYMLYPRLLALAERAWHKADWQLSYAEKGRIYDKHSGVFTTQKQAERDTDWQRFAALVGLKEIAKLEKQGVFYRVPTVAAAVNNGKLDAFTPYPGFAIEVQDKQGTWHAINHIKDVNDARYIRARSETRIGRSLSLK